MPTVSLICGFIGAGKTTFARKLEAETDAVRITKDEWSIRLIGNDPTIDGYARHDHNIVELLRNVAYQLAGKGVNVILDEGFWEKQQRRELRQWFEAIGARVVIYFIDTPLDVMRARVANRNNADSPDSFLISEALFESYLPL